MSFKKITQVVLECVCELPDCPGVDEKGNHIPWISRTDKKPKRCNWCHRYTWDGEDGRATAQLKANETKRKKLAAAKKNTAAPASKAVRAGRGFITMPKPKKVRFVIE